jgi:hypothetical protein
MPAPWTLMQAALARLGARMGSGLLDAAAGAAVLAQDAPAQVRRELKLFWEEVELEAERLERGEGADSQQPAGDGAAGHAGDPPAGPRDVQASIDALRAQVAGFSRRLDQAP